MGRAATSFTTRDEMAPHGDQLRGAELSSGNLWRPVECLYLYISVDELTGLRGGGHVAHCGSRHKGSGSPDLPSPETDGAPGGKMPDRCLPVG